MVIRFGTFSHQPLKPLTPSPAQTYVQVLYSFCTPCTQQNPALGRKG